MFLIMDAGENQRQSAICENPGIQREGVISTRRNERFDMLPESNACDSSLSREHLPLFGKEWYIFRSYSGVNGE
jgi:hypothetical protein